MNKREARLRARRLLQVTAELVVAGKVGNLAEWTDDGSEKEQDEVARQLLHLSRVVLRSPPGWDFLPPRARRPATTERVDQS